MLRATRLPGKAFLTRGHPLEPREPAIGYASRLAALNGVAMADLLMDMRINVRDLGRGNAAAVKGLADLRSLSAGDRDALTRYTPWRTVGDQIAAVAGNRLLPRSILSTSVRICPHCVAEDMVGFEGPRNARPWLRLEWVCRHIRACGRHGNLLVEVASSHPTHRTFDFSRTLADQVLPRLDRFRNACVPGPGGAFGDWIVARLDGVVDPSNWLDDVPLHAGIAFCELLGFSSRHGLETIPTSHPVSEWAMAAEEGYRTASLGKVAIDALLNRMVEQRPSKRGFLGHEKAYGHLYLHLRRYAMDAGYGKVRAVVREHAFATIPFSPGRSVLGVKLEARRVHNQVTAARTCARSGAGMRRLLAGSGIDLTGDVDPLKARIKIPVGDFEAVVAAMGEYATTTDVVKATGFDRKLVDRLADEGILKSLPPDARPAGRYYRFRRGDVDELMSRLFRDAIGVDGTTGRKVSVAKARNTARGYAGDILAMILDGSLAWVGRLGFGDRYEHLLVDIDEVVAIMRAEPVRKGMYAKEAEALIPGVYKSNISRLAKAGLLSSTTEFCEKSMRTMDVLTRESVEAFAAEYVSVTELGADTGVHVKVVARRLLVAGVVEAIDRDIPKTRIYRRREVAASGALAGWPASR